MNIVNLIGIIKPSTWGGTESVTLESSKALKKLGHNVIIAASPKPGSTEASSIDGVEIKKINPIYPHLWRPQYRPDILHWHMGPYMSIFTMNMAKHFKIPYVMSVHIPLFGFKDIDYNSKPSLKFFEQSAAIISVSNEEIPILKERFPDKRIIYQPNGVNTEPFQNTNPRQFKQDHNIPLDAKVLLCVSRTDPLKNQLLLIRAFSELLKQYSHDIYLVFVGRVVHEEYYGLVQNEIKMLELEAKIRYITDLNPSNPNHANAYAAADIFILPSLAEPFGITILEAWAAKTPVIASNVGGIPYFVDHEKNGLLFQNNKQEELVSYMLRLLHNPSYAAELGQSGYCKIKAEYEWDIIARQLEKAYAEIIKDFNLSNSKGQRSA